MLKNAEVGQLWTYDGGVFLALRQEEDVTTMLVVSWDSRILNNGIKIEWTLEDFAVDEVVRLI